jgi:hypothetical protein
MDALSLGQSGVTILDYRDARTVAGRSPAGTIFNKVGLVAAAQD